jgi:hypothetical protein
MLAACPSRNLVSNIGFGNGATHTDDPAHSHANRETWPVLTPLKHPTDVQRDVTADHYTFDEIFAFLPRREKYLVRRAMRNALGDSVYDGVKTLLGRP